MRILAAIQGDLPRYMRDELKLAEQAVTGGLRLTGNDLKAALRADVVQAGLGARLSKTWRSNTYPDPGSSLNAATEVFSVAPKIIEGFDTGATIRAKNKSFLAVPSEACPKVGRDGRSITPANWPEGQWGPLRFVARKGENPLLVVDNLRARLGKGRGGQFTKASKRALKTPSRLWTVVMFTLVPQVRLKKRLNVSQHMTLAEKMVALSIDKEFIRLDRERQGRK